VQRPPSLRVLIVSREYPAPGRHGSGVYTLDIARYLHNSGFRLDYLFLGELALDYDRLHHLDFEVARLMRVIAPGQIVFGRVGLPRPVGWKGWLAAALRPIYNRLPQALRRGYRSVRGQPKTGNNIGSRRPVSPMAHDSLATMAEMEAFSQAYQRLKPEVVIIDYAWLAPLLDQIEDAERVVTVILTKDVLHRRVEDFARLGIASGHAGWTSAEESALLQKAQLLVAIQAEEAAVLRSMVPTADVVSAPLSGLPRITTGRQVPGRCLFVGSRGQHNVHGLEWFLRQVWPRVLRAVPDASLHVCGSVCEGVTADGPQVQFLGMVPDLGPEYSLAQVCLAPLLMGSGLKIKLIEALAYGRASVATSQSLQGVEVLRSRAVLAADTPEEFAAAVVTVLSDTGVRDRLENQARLLAETQFSPEQCYQPFVERIRAHLAGLP
jgi:hypothetical protein